MPGAAIEGDGLGRLIDRLDDMAKAGPARAVEKMDAALAEGFAATQAAAHVRTGRTRESGRAYSSYTPGEWTGTVEYGIEGPESLHETGAIWEIARGGEHDFLAPLAETERQVGEVLDAWMREQLED